MPDERSQVDVVAREYGGLARTYTYGINVSGSGRTFTYDPNGNLTGDGTRTFQWDAENRLIRVLQGATELASFTYDGRGRRAQKVAGGVTRTYIYDSDEILEERTSAVTVRYFHGVGIDQHLAAQDTSGTVSYYVADHLGSIVRVTNGVGTVTLTRDYDPYGNLLTGSTQPTYAFTGREWDAETGLYYYRAGYYDPKIGRFVSEDPIRFRGGINFYAYVDDNPVNESDPLGLTGELCTSPVRKASSGWLPHEHVCVEVNGKRTCQGLVPAGNVFFSGGAYDASDDADKGGCTKVSNTPCMDNCILNEFKAPPPNYSVLGIGGEQCVSYAREIIADCLLRCSAQGYPVGGPSKE